jgi:hypothetical protein
MLRGRLDFPATGKIEPQGLDGLRSAVSLASSLPNVECALHVVLPTLVRACSTLCANHYLLLSLMFSKVRSISIKRLFKSLVVLEMPYKYEFACSSSFVILSKIKFFITRLAIMITRKDRKNGFAASQKASKNPSMSSVSIESALS